MAEMKGNGTRISGRQASRPGALVSLLLLALLGSGCTALVVGGAGNRSSYPDSRSEAAQAADAKISAAVRQALSGDARLAQASIEVSSRDGVVTLQGSVADYQARSQAELLTAGVAGVSGIHNRLQLAKR